LSTVVKICIRRRHTSESQRDRKTSPQVWRCGDGSALAGDIHAKHQAAPPTTSYTQEAEHLGKQRAAVYVLPMMVILGLRAFGLGIKYTGDHLFPLGQDADGSTPFLVAR